MDESELRIKIKEAIERYQNESLYLGKRRTAAARELRLFNDGGVAALRMVLEWMNKESGEWKQKAEC